MNTKPKIDPTTSTDLITRGFFRSGGPARWWRADPDGPRSERTPPPVAPRTTTPQADFATTREQTRRAQRRRLYRAAAIGVLGPTLLAVIYYAVIAPPQYEVDTEFTIRGRLKPAPDLLAGLGLPGTTNTTNDAYIVIDYLQSPGTIDLLKAHYRFKQAYSRFSLDPTAYLPPDAPTEWAVDFWGHKLKADYDTQADAVTIKVKAYRAEDALQLAKGVVQASTDVVDALNARVQQGSLQQALIQVTATRHDYDEVKGRLAKLQGNVNALTYDAPTKEAEAEIGAIDAALAGLNVNLGTVVATFKPNAPQTKAIQAQIAELESARARALAKAKSAPGLSATEHDVMLQAALLDYEFASKSYLSALSALQAAEPGTVDKNFVVDFLPPRLPEQSDYLKRFLNVIAVFLGASVLFGVGALGYSVIKDHIQ